MIFAERVKKARKHAGLSQRELADCVGISQTSITDLERGKSKSTSLTVEIAAACQVNAIWLASGEGLMLSQVSGLVSIPKPLLPLKRLHDCGALHDEDWAILHNLASCLAKKNKNQRPD